MNFDTQLSDSSAVEMRESGTEVIPVPDSLGREAFTYRCLYLHNKSDKPLSVDLCNVYFGIRLSA